MPADAPPRRGPNREPVRVGGAATAYSVIDYPDEIAAATAQLKYKCRGVQSRDDQATAHRRGDGLPVQLTVV
jgi:hypothetical protein